MFHVISEKVFYTFNFPSGMKSRQYDDVNECQEAADHAHKYLNVGPGGKRLFGEAPEIHKHVVTEMRRVNHPV